VKLVMAAPGALTYSKRPLLMLLMLKLKLLAALSTSLALRFAALSSTLPP
jgi:hypothetical protein